MPDVSLLHRKDGSVDHIINEIIDKRGEIETIQLTARFKDGTVATIFSDQNVERMALMGLVHQRNINRRMNELNTN